MLDMDVIYRDYAKTVFGYLVTLCHEEHTAEELTQETFYQAVKSGRKSLSERRKNGVVQKSTRFKRDSKRSGPASFNRSIFFSGDRGYIWKK